MRRRCLICGGAAFGLSTAVNRHSIAQETLNRDFINSGCILTGSALSNAIDTELFFARSGMTGIDSEIKNQVDILNNTLGQSAQFVFYNDLDGLNAWALPLGQGKVVVAFGIRLLHKELKTSNPFQASESDSSSIIAWGGAVAGIMAHEWGHVMQFTKMDMQTILHRRGMKAELHADYLAGWFMARNRAVKNVNYEQVRSSFYSMGDELPISNPMHHGTKEQRSSAITEGFRASRENNLSSDEAFDKGLTFIDVLLSK